MRAFSQGASAAVAELDRLGSEAVFRDLACRLLRGGDDDLPELLSAAQSARARFKPGFITYSRKVFIPLTKLCRDYCGYCTFRRDPDEHHGAPEPGFARHLGELGLAEGGTSSNPKTELAEGGAPSEPPAGRRRYEETGAAGRRRYAYGHDAGLTNGSHTMSPDEVMEVVRAGERLGCTEALFSLGDKPELVFPEMRETLRHLGYKSTLHYLEAMCERVLRESSLLPHPNPGLMSAEWLGRLARVAPSMGLMLETTSARLMAKGAAHDGAPDKDPAKRLRVIEDAGRQGIPFTTGILIGIGETLEERVDSLIAIRELHEKYGHVQEVIVQNFRAKAGTPMAGWPEPTREDMLRTLAVARLLMPRMNIQAPPNLSDPHYADLLDGGINDWGGVSPLTPDFINPEKPWPHLDRLRERTEAKGFELRQRLPVYAEFAGMAAGKSEVVRERIEGWRTSAAKAAVSPEADGAAPPQIAQGGRSGDPVEAARHPKALCEIDAEDNGADRDWQSRGRGALGTAGGAPALRSGAVLKPGSDCSAPGPTSGVSAQRSLGGSTERERLLRGGGA